MTGTEIRQKLSEGNDPVKLLWEVYREKGATQSQLAVLKNRIIELEKKITEDTKTIQELARDLEFVKAFREKYNYLSQQIIQLQTNKIIRKNIRKDVIRIIDKATTEQVNQQIDLFRETISKLFGHAWGKDSAEWAKNLKENSVLLCMSLGFSEYAFLCTLTGSNDLKTVVFE